ncbi:MAG: Phytoene dehydrogenase, partial [Acidimicrobiales bacterium]|nr:Phytoene dehydrogenase [Acidimicrobiales bacterium]
NVDRRVPGLVFVGSGTVPGVSVPMVLISGRLAADRVDGRSFSVSPRYSRSNAKRTAG